MRISDWSSDVCSSDLICCGKRCATASQKQKSRTQCKSRASLEISKGVSHVSHLMLRILGCTRIWVHCLLCTQFLPRSWSCTTLNEKIGRASCRERVCQYV